jgi:PIN domain nuclease of toxin-antitoxin system
VRLLLDTHYAYALAGARGRFSAAERDFLAHPPGILVISAVSIWEMRLKWESLFASGARKGPVSPTAAVRVLEAQPLTWLPLLPVHAAAQLETSLHHQDPFDELLLLQAQVEDMRLVTRDARLADHPLAIVAG